MELSSVDEEVVVPDFIKIIKDVTAGEAYRNSSIAFNGNRLPEWTAASKLRSDERSLFYLEGIAVFGDGDTGETHGAELFASLVAEVGGDDFETRIWFC